MVVNDILDMASYNGQNYTPCDHCFKINGEEISIWLKKTFTESYWQSADANAVISELVRIMITYVWQTEKQKIAAQMLVFN